LQKNRAILMIGNFLSQKRSTRSMCEDLAERLQETGLTVITTSNRTTRVVRLLDMLWSVWWRQHSYELAQIDVFSGRAFLWTQAVCWLLRQIHKPFILTLHGGNLPSFAQTRGNDVRRLLNSAQIVTTPSRYLLEEMSPYRADLKLIPNALDLSNYAYIRRDHPAPRLIWLRAFLNLYNPTLAPKAIAKLVKDFHDLQLIMIGPDKGRDSALQDVRDIAKELRVFDHIQFPGGIAKSDVPLWLNKGDIFINTTNVDNTPVSIIEAMACGLPIVSTNVGGIPYLLKDEQDALLVPPDDAEAMANAIRRILTEPELAKYLSDNGRQKAEQFDWSVVLPKWQDIFRNII